MVLLPGIRGTQEEVTTLPRSLEPSLHGMKLAVIPGRAIRFDDARLGGAPRRKETTMALKTKDEPFRVGFFDYVAQADQAVRNLLAAGFTKQQLAVICPDKFKSSFAPGVPRAERPASRVPAAIVEGGAVGAALGGVALVATAIATGGVGVLPALPVLVGGGALAGGFSSLITSDGYFHGIGEYFEEAVHYGRIVVGVELRGTEEDLPRLAEAECILTDAGATLPHPEGE
jgi:hypothetical protein